MIRAASRAAVESLRGRLTQVESGLPVTTGLTGLADELYSIANLLVAQPQLRRTTADQAKAPEARAGLITGLLSGKVSPAALELTDAAARLRWSSSWDLPDTIEGLGNEALLTVAERVGQLDEVEDQLFRFERILDGQPELVSALDDSTASTQRRVQLVTTLVAGKVSPITLSLLAHAVTSSRKRSIALAVDDLVQATATRQMRSVARVTSAVALTATQETRLAQTLTTIYQRAISVRTSVDPSVRGGLVIQVGDEIIDGSVAARFAAARSALTGSK
jgi:F-type H+-transporting ATPase subunit delta